MIYISINVYFYGEQASFLRQILQKCVTRGKVLSEWGTWLLLIAPVVNLPLLLALKDVVQTSERSAENQFGDVISVFCYMGCMSLRTR